MKLKLCFDCDDTLYDLSWPFRMSVERLFPKETICKFDVEKLYIEYRKYGDEIFDLIQNGKITVFDSGVYRIERLCQAHGIPISHQGAKKFQQVYSEYQKNISMSDELKEFLESTNAELAIITNGEEQHQKDKLRALKAYDYFKSTSIFVSGEVGYAKPDPRLFTTVMERLHELPDDWIYIGDHYENDMVGAKAAGMKTIHFNRHHKTEGPDSDYVVYSETELIQLLKGFEN